MSGDQGKKPREGGGTDVGGPTADGNSPGAPARPRAPRIATDLISVSQAKMPGAVTAAELDAALEKFRPQFEAYEAFRKSLPPEPPPTDTAIPIWVRPKGAKKSIELVAFLNRTLDELGYEQVGRQNVDTFTEIGFRDRRSNSFVERFVRFTSFGGPTEYISARFGLRHTPADLFANEEDMRFLPSSHRSIFDNQPSWRCRMNFPLGDSADWGPRDALFIPDCEESVLAQRIEGAFADLIADRLAAISDIQGLFDLTTSGAGPFPWSQFGNNGRVSIVGYLGLKLGRAPAELRSMLVPHVSKFKRPPNTSEPTAEEFVDMVLKDADAALGRR
jgi:hypothetical protein